MRNALFFCSFRFVNLRSGCIRSYQFEKRNGIYTLKFIVRSHLCTIERGNWSTII